MLQAVSLLKIPWYNIKPLYAMKRLSWCVVVHSFRNSALTASVSSTEIDYQSSNVWPVQLHNGKHRVWDCLSIKWLLFAEELRFNQRFGLIFNELEINFVLLLQKFVCLIRHSFGWLKVCCLLFVFRCKSQRKNFQ